MRHITRKQVAAEVKDRFAEQYGPKFEVHLFGDSAAIYRELVALGGEPSVDDVEALVPGWTKLKCDNCRKYVNAVVEVGEPPDYESKTAAICRSCAIIAASLFD